MAISARSRQYRSDLDQLVEIARSDLRVLLGQVGSADEARDALMDVMPRLIATYGAAAATLAADWYDDIRDAAGTAGRFLAIAASPAAVSEVDVRWAVGPMYQAEPDRLTTLERTTGKAQLYIANAGRLSVTTSSIQDRGARGWRRVGNDKCDWCAQFLTGVVHATPGYGFAAHDHCKCSAEPVFK